MAVRKLEVDIVSMLKGNGFAKLDGQVDKAKNKISRMGKLMDNSFVRMGASFFGAAAAVGVYKKAIEGANIQLEQEIKLQSTLSAQGFTKGQIQGVKDYASELQTLGIVGDEVTLAGAQQLATYNLTEQQLKSLMPTLQDVAVQQDGYNVSTGTAVNVANMLGKAIMGQAGALSRAGITLNAYQEEMIKTGNQSQKVAALIEAVRMNVGEQNKEFLNTPEGRIIQVQNRIGDVYENIGFQLKKGRVAFFDFIGDNLEGIEDMVMSGIAFFQDMGSGIAKGVGAIWDAFQAMPEDVKTVIELVGGFFFLSAFPITGAIIVLQDLWAAFSGGESVTEDVFNSVMNFLGLSYRFTDFRDDVKELWAAFKEGEYLKTIFEWIGLSIKGFLINPIKAVLRLLKGDWKGALDTIKDTGKQAYDFGVNIKEREQKRKGLSLTREEMEYTPALVQGPLSPVSVTQGNIYITQATDINGIEKIVDKKNSELAESLYLLSKGRGR
ncbi:hypothetical protein [uncultured Ilyobacter sp.]|uniref:hypothetical protein n=1 Tax=uncultured Ilyobacter sp. TaxID=544433 RepID=UPI0029C6C10C|nr:hypothetical protein [uncultured Ilyobacter sp.]